MAFAPGPHYFRQSPTALSLSELRPTRRPVKIRERFAYSNNFKFSPRPRFDDGRPGTARPFPAFPLTLTCSAPSKTLDPYQVDQATTERAWTPQSNSLSLAEAPRTRPRVGPAQSIRISSAMNGGEVDYHTTDRYIKTVFSESAWRTPLPPPIVELKGVRSPLHASRMGKNIFPVRALTRETPFDAPDDCVANCRSPGT
eukprot:TRINITY_DN8762_c0_g1_i2.p2 TRINITY_DN8762_c0_g1~~TRINITY_DN8762_c0_g1_i2.p2  ORF type:complete len:199 (-),score=15.17 TRINITY_DN8762_c0_g1_i2:290-886(-)